MIRVSTRLHTGFGMARRPINVALAAILNSGRSAFGPKGISAARWSMSFVTPAHDTGVQSGLLDTILQGGSVKRPGCDDAKGREPGPPATAKPFRAPRYRRKDELGMRYQNVTPVQALAAGGRAHIVQLPR